MFLTLTQNIFLLFNAIAGVKICDLLKAQNIDRMKTSSVDKYKTQEKYETAGVCEASEYLLVTQIKSDTEWGK